jgi:nitrate reductase NapAB chaperone NapD
LLFSRIIFWALLAISVVLIFLIKFSPLKDIHTSEIDFLSWFPYGEEVGQVVFDLGIGYIVSCLFYYIVVYLPEKKKRQSAMTILNKRIDLILQSMEITLQYFSYKYHVTKSMDEKSIQEKFSKIKTLESINRMNFYYQYKDEKGNQVYLNTGIYNEISWMVNQLLAVKKYIQKIFQYPAITSVDQELIVALEKINRSPLHKTLESLKEFPTSQTPELGENLYEYYLLYKELRKYISPTEFSFHQDPVKSWWDIDILKGIRQYREPSNE